MLKKTLEDQSTEDKKNDYKRVQSAAGISRRFKSKMLSLFD